MRTIALEEGTAEFCTGFSNQNLQYEGLSRLEQSSLIELTHPG